MRAASAARNHRARHVYGYAVTVRHAPRASYSTHVLMSIRHGALSSCTPTGRPKEDGSLHGEGAMWSSAHVTLDNVIFEGNRHASSGAIQLETQLRGNDHILGSFTATGCRSATTLVICMNV
jgi:hypothetical protein